MPYNMFLDFSVFFGRLLFKMIFIGLIIYTKVAKYRLKQHFNEFFLFPRNVHLPYRDVSAPLHR